MVGYLAQVSANLGRRRLERQYGRDQCSLNNKREFGGRLIGWMDFIKEEQIDCDLSYAADFSCAQSPKPFTADLIEQAEALARLVDFPAIAVWRSSGFNSKKLAQMPIMVALLVS